MVRTNLPTRAGAGPDRSGSQRSLTGDAMPPIGHTHSATAAGQPPSATRERRASAWRQRHPAAPPPPRRASPQRPTGRRAPPCPTTPRSRWTATAHGGGPRPDRARPRHRPSGRSRPTAAEEEDAGRFPREIFTLLSESGLLGPALRRGVRRRRTSPYEVYLQVLEELAAARLTVGLGVSVHTLACHALAALRHQGAAGRAPARTCSAAACSAPTASPSPPPAPTPPRCAPGPSATATTGVINGTKAWITHGGVADFYTVLARTGGERRPRHHAPSWSPGDAEG